jgi:hypothetical protein
MQVCVYPRAILATCSLVVTTEADGVGLASCDVDGDGEGVAEKPDAEPVGELDEVVETVIEDVAVAETDHVVDADDDGVLDPEADGVALDDGTGACH